MPDMDAATPDYVLTCGKCRALFGGGGGTIAVERDSTRIGPDFPAVGSGQLCESCYMEALDMVGKWLTWE